MKLRNKLKSGIILILTLLFIVIISNFVSAEEVIGEVGNVTVTDSLVWTWIDFEASYDSTPVIIATITTMNNCPGTCSGTSSGNGGNSICLLSGSDFFLPRHFAIFSKYFIS